jgi:sulfur relay (sulfurtransferase) complex TusBCD TusD component (DsrE family)
MSLLTHVPHVGVWKDLLKEIVAAIISCTLAIAHRGVLDKHHDHYSSTQNSSSSIWVP